ncbi:MAG: GspH/FimT family pseudopilin [Myxococcota bacterium]|jgi:prepilin-type N-terminal cleavage/methylation domain-containing protein|nr:GspH/FimT family pseudopilin [Myxococcota bacterium]
MMTVVKKHRAQAGYTLVELMTVVGVIGILAALAVGFSGDFRQRNHFHEVAREVFHTMSIGRAEAMRRGKTVMVNTYTAANKETRIAAFIDGVKGSAATYDSSYDILLYEYPATGDDNLGYTGISVTNKTIRFNGKGFCVDSDGNLTTGVVTVTDSDLGEERTVESTVAGAIKVSTPSAVSSSSSSGGEISSGSGK